MDFIIKDVRLAFPDLWVPGKPGKDGKPGKFGATLILGTNQSEQFKLATQNFIAAAQATFGANWQNFISAMEASKKCIRDGNKNLHSQTGEIRTGFAGMMYLVAKNKVKPPVVAHRKHNGQFVMIGEDGSGWVNGQIVTDLPFEIVRPYGGCYVNAKVEIYAMKAKGDIAANVACSLKSIQFLRHGEAFGAGPGTPDGFEDEGGDEGEGNFGGAPAAAGGEPNFF